MNLFSLVAPLPGGAAILLALAGASAPALSADAGRTIPVYKTPWCECYTARADRMRAAGLSVELTELEDLSPVREQLAIPPAVAGCHLATVAG